MVLDSIDQLECGSAVSHTQEVSPSHRLEQTFSKQAIRVTDLAIVLARCFSSSDIRCIEQNEWVPRRNPPFETETLASTARYLVSAA